MSVHPSLRISEKDKKQRSVLKRAERLKIMMDKKQWKEGNPVWGLPKIKTVKIKIKKEKAEKTETTAKAAATAGQTAPAEAQTEQPQGQKSAAKAKS